MELSDRAKAVLRDLLLLSAEERRVLSAVLRKEVGEEPAPTTSSYQASRAQTFWEHARNAARGLGVRLCSMDRLTLEERKAVTEITEALLRGMCLEDLHNNLTYREVQVTEVLRRLAGIAVRCLDSPGLPLWRGGKEAERRFLAECLRTIDRALPHYRTNKLLHMILQGRGNHVW